MKNELSTTHLKACPFCGQRPELGVILINEWGHYTVRCVNQHCAAAPYVRESAYAVAVEKWNNRAEEGKNTKFITKLNHTDIEVLDSANGSRLIYRFQDGSWWLIDGPDDPHVDRGDTK